MNLLTVISVLLVMALGLHIKGVAANSCQGRCGENFNVTNECHCNDECRRFGSCCEDFIQLCANETSCDKRCGENYDETMPCHCDSGCSLAGNCCDDFNTLCITSCAERCFEADPPSNAVCHCDGDCQQFDNCCNDFSLECLDPSNRTCQNRCGEDFNQINFCHCTDDCRKYGNCCEDFIPLCASTDSCTNRCGESYTPSLPCQCNADCPQFGNCCDNFESLCIASCEGRCFETDQSLNSVCRCDRNCEEFDNCCDDYLDFCEEEKYLCKGNCSVERLRCSCLPGCVDNSSCCADYEETCLMQPPWVEENCAPAEEMRCPSDFEVPPVILFSIDGYRSEYIYRQLTPNIWKLASCGVHAPYMRSVYPTKTFPNHYTIATGLYPESHGIIDNTMYDHQLQEEFRLGSPESFHPAWWGGEPIWVTTSNQGRKSACYFWPGSDVNITRYPDYYYKYDGSVDNEERMYQALDWLDLPREERPSFITLYMDIVDGAGHDGGPVSPGVNSALVEVDRVIGILMNGLKLRNLENCVNLIVLADHGMAPTSCDRKTSLEDFGVNMDIVYARTGAFGRVGKSTDPDLWEQFDEKATQNMLRCTHDESHWLSDLKYQYLPKRHHYAFNDRIEPVLLKMDDEWLVEGRKNSNSRCNGGTHGYDNEYKSMHALFAAHGPGFKRDYNTTEPFEAIEVYNLMADLLQLEPAPNNGTRSSLNHVMSNPLLTPPTAIRQLSQCLPLLQPHVDETCFACQGFTDEQLQQQLDLGPLEASESLGKHLPFDIGYRSEMSVCQLIQRDYVNVFHRERKIASTVSFQLNQQSFDLIAPYECVRSDPRFQITPPCDDYVKTENIFPVPLYPAELSNGNNTYDAIIISNQVPMYYSTKKVWNYMARSMAKWADEYGGIHVTAGPIFDYNFDGLPDSDEILVEHGKYLNDDFSSTPIPTHFFLIAIRCVDERADLAECGTMAESDVLSFIIPNYEIEPCHKENAVDSDWIPQTLVEHVARIKDIELLTGIIFYPGFQTDPQSEIRFSLRLPQFSGEWVNNFLYTVPPTSGVDGRFTTSVIDTTSSAPPMTSHFILLFTLFLILLSLLL